MFFATRSARPHQAAAFLALAGLGLGLATGPALAQPKKPAAPAQQPAAPAQPAQGAAQQQTGPQVVQVKSEPSQTEWTKVCGKDQGSGAEVCYTTRDFVSEQGQPVLAAAIYDLKGAQGNARVARFLLPLGLLLQPGIRFSVDQGQALPGRYAVCFPNGCFAEVPGLKDDIIAALKKGTTLNLSVQNQAQREVTFAVPLAGFGKAFDGAPIDPKVLEEQQKKLQAELERRSEEMRKQLEAQKNGAAAPAAPQAPAANAAPK
ncbi:invasion associated locus B family protein [Methylobacterium nodulans]|uniref:Invasion associated locus B family protein n=1 Tax=Methylobacterium nodulans (strain LMG 21967 / CNCM I-2342 / ORS 2060) TaxID=460265 RepID=B8IKD5_METNO|nr:invasion associated locus B family protein [Methylobacterium nodulans]ACL61920.1 Invasion associated locus B family protein [Methylobacterium nodulans ORS 2060]